MPDTFVDDNNTTCFIDDDGVVQWVDDNDNMLTCGDERTKQVVYINFVPP